MQAAERRFRVMGCEAQVVVTCPDTVTADDPTATGWLDEAEAHLRHLEARWSRFLADSDVSRVNLANGRPVPTHPDTLTLVAVMQEAWRATGGLVDPTVLPLVAAEGYRASVHDPRRLTLLPSGQLRWAAMDDVRVDPADGTVTAPRGVTLDPGALGKGLAADLATLHLRAIGAPGALVSIGGDLAAAGTAPSADGWLVDVEAPDDPDTVIRRLALAHGGVATSSTRGRHGPGTSHVIDPRTGRPAATDLVSVTVVASRGWSAEAHATAGLLVGAAGVLDHLAEHSLSGLAVRTDGVVLTTPDLDLDLARGAA